MKAARGLHVARESGGKVAVIVLNGEVPSRVFAAMCGDMSVVGTRIVSKSVSE